MFSDVDPKELMEESNKLSETMIKALGEVLAKEVRDIINEHPEEAHRTLELAVAAAIASFGLWGFCAIIGMDQDDSQELVGGIMKEMNLIAESRGGTRLED